MIAFGLATVIGIELSQEARRRVPEESSVIPHLVNIGIANNITAVVDPVSTPIGASKRTDVLGNIVIPGAPIGRACTTLTATGIFIIE